MDHKTRRFSNIIFFLTFLLAVFGLVMVKDASSVWAQYLYGDRLYFFKRQLLFFLLGIAAFFCGYRIKPQLIFKYVDALMIVALVLLGLVLIPGIGQVKNGSRSWFGIGGFGFQPSELFKIVFLIYAAKFLACNYHRTVTLRGILPVILIALLGFVLTMLEPDFGTGLVTLMGLAMLIFLSRLPLRYFVGIGGAAAAGFAVLIIAEPYRFLRITAFLDPYQDPLGAGFQIIQSLYALGPSGISGLGFANSMQKHFYLPEPQTDFIFAIIVEEFGLIGGLLLVAVYGFLFYCCYRYALKMENMFLCYLKLGLTNVIMMQTLINLCVVVGILPVTGITLPLVSYGGSSMVITLFSFGLICSKGEMNEDYLASRGDRRTHPAGSLPRFGIKSRKKRISDRSDG